MICPVCRSDRFHRRHRSFAERLRYAAVYECRACHCRDVETYAEHLPFLSRVARCPECGGTDLRPLSALDPIERLYRNPFSYVQKFFGAPLLYCAPCRFQFYDLRPLKKREPNPAASADPPPPRASGASATS